MLIAPRLRRFAALAMLAWGLAVGTEPAAAEDRSASSRDVSGVVELFTSQGCASCPPADRVLTDLARDPTLVALAYHVNYWDYIGWRDPHASADNGERQNGYAEALRSGSVYTPQVVVNGRRSIVGTKEDEIRRAVSETALNGAGAAPNLKLEIRGDRLHVAAEGEWRPAAGQQPVLMLVTFKKWSENAVERGENEGKTLGSTNVVKSWRVLGMWEGKPIAVDLPLETIQYKDKRLGCAVILQNTAPDGAPGPIIAAAAIAQ